MALNLPEAALRKLCDFVDLLLKWNRVHNLTSVDDPRKILTHHLLDSLSIAPYVQPTTCIDVGSGAGFPGMVLAICYPDQHWTLVESRSKKAGFLRDAKAHLGVANLSVFDGRIEDYRATANFDTLTARAVTTIKSLLKVSEHLLNPRLRLIAMKGVFPGEEIAALTSHQAGLARVIPVTVPGLDASRHIVVMEGISG